MQRLQRDKALIDADLSSTRAFDGRAGRACSPSASGNGGMNQICHRSFGLTQHLIGTSHLRQSARRVFQAGPPREFPLPLSASLAAALLFSQRILAHSWRLPPSGSHLQPEYRRRYRFAAASCRNAVEIAGNFGIVLDVAGIELGPEVLRRVLGAIPITTAMSVSLHGFRFEECSQCISAFEMAR